MGTSHVPGFWLRLYQSFADHILNGFMRDIQREKREKFMTTNRIIFSTLVVDPEMYAELRCTCVKTMSQIHPSSISKLEIIREGAHCTKIELI